MTAGGGDPHGHERHRSPGRGPTGPEAGAAPLGEYVPARAEVVNVPCFSAHADATEVIAWLRDGGAPAPSAAHLVHGEPDAAQTLRDRIDGELGWNAVVPRSGERVLVR
ncbi:MBL fold metallo-hydrolase RNA specificity domain-containing protein [Streptomyces sp. HM190]|uniref:MBL fold metallo-hydrolase RNA specificity domain-containing protein n=1 Tax=Streptomyces sp. HM190 TaxID=2695266 RepID=UPI0013589501|nr:MBL fold metallo-hydrolase RNA specificity domain-containing protein [Streptomyces sp. HM190]